MRRIRCIVTALVCAAAVLPVTPASAALLDVIRHQAEYLPPVVPRPRFIFPVAGPHRIGVEPAQRFGGARGHGGQDVFARCGTPVVAPVAGRVERRDYESAGGNYVVIDARDRRSYVFMHLRRPALPHAGAWVTAGQRLGRVGRTGDADGCHLHFEAWTAPGWYRGHAVDPYRRLDRSESEAVSAGSA